MTEQQIMRLLAKRLETEYKDTQSAVKDKIAVLSGSFEKTNKLYQQQVKDGVITKEAYRKWYKQQVTTAKWCNDMITELSTDVTNANLKAYEIINQNTSEVYIGGALEGGKEIGKYPNFDLVDRKQAEKLLKDNNDLLPKAKLNIPKDQKWNERRMRSAVLQSAIKGESITKLSKRLEYVVGMNKTSAVRNARTMMTASHNMGKLDVGREAQEMGIDVRKKWLATFDNRTRDSHALLHGEIVDIDEEFSNGLMFPADPDGDPSEVYNCRCTFRYTHEQKQDGMSREEFDEKVDEVAEKKEAWRNGEEYVPKEQPIKEQPKIQIPDDIENKVSSFEDKYYNAKTEHYMSIDKDGKIIFESDTRGKRNVSVPRQVDEYNTNGWSVHNHPAEAIFSSADIRNYEKYGQHGFVIDNTGMEYLLYNLNPKPNYIALAKVATEEEFEKIMPFTTAVDKAFDEIEDKIIAERREYSKKLKEMYSTSVERSKALSKWMKDNSVNSLQIKWLEENAENYGFIFRKRKVKN